MLTVWVPVSRLVGPDSQSGVSRNHSQTLRLLDIDSCRVPPVEGKLKLGGEGVRVQVLGFRVAYKMYVTLPLFRVTVLVRTEPELFGENVAVIVDGPVPDDGEMVCTDESPVAVQAHEAGVVTKLQVT